MSNMIISVSWMASASVVRVAPSFIAMMPSDSPVSSPRPDRSMMAFWNSTFSGENSFLAAMASVTNLRDVRRRAGGR